MTGEPVLAVWTDFGGVLTPPNAVTLTAYCARIGVPIDVLQQAVMKVTARYGTTDPMEPLDTPMVAEDVWTRQVEEVLAGDCGLRVELGDFGAAWFDGRPANADWLAVLRGLKAAGLYVGMLSNMVPTWDRHWRAMLGGAEELFDSVLMSFQVGFRKPGPEIFELAAKTAGVAPASCLLVDDLPANCAGARAAGWQAVEFQDVPGAVRLLQSAIGADVPIPTPIPTRRPEDRREKGGDQP
jgi:putative hydrolase of the HAD superfamily